MINENTAKVMGLPIQMKVRTQLTTVENNVFGKNWHFKYLETTIITNNEWNIDTDSHINWAERAYFVVFL